MRKFFLGLTSVLASASLMFGVAAAEPSCTIENTGPHSFNKCTDTTTNKTTITCKNDVDVVFVNNQQASSGNSTVLDNTNGGSATTGDANNSNDTNANLNISCGAKIASSPAPSPTPVPVAAVTPTPSAAQSGGQGQGQAQAAPKAQALPETGSNPAVATVAVAASVLGVLAVAARFGLSAYKQFVLK